MNRKEKLKRILDAVTRKTPSDESRETKKRLEDLKSSVRNDLVSISKSFSSLRSESTEKEKLLIASIEARLKSFNETIEKLDSSKEISKLKGYIEYLIQWISRIDKRKVQIPNFQQSIDATEVFLNKVILSIKRENEESQKDLQKSIEKLSKEVITLRSFRSGGNANRNISVGGNSSTLGRYTDINFLPGTNVTLSYANNDNLKTTDITITSAGGAGTSRSISTVNVSSVLAATASTDIVVIASAGVQLTLPTASGNTNLYTVKNTSTSSVLIGTTGAETIDADSSIILNTRYTAVDLISDNSNWHIT